MTPICQPSSYSKVVLSPGSLGWADDAQYGLVLAVSLTRRYGFRLTGGGRAEMARYGFIESQWDWTWSPPEEEEWRE